MTEILSHSSAETEQLGERIASFLRGGEVIALFGGLGAGKTAFTRGLARGLGVPLGVSSPTFALVREYAGRLRLCHFDMYRITSWEDLYSTGFFDYLGTEDVLVIEWSENIEKVLPENAIRIEIGQGSTENERVFRITGLAIGGES